MGCAGGYVWMHRSRLAASQTAWHQREGCRAQGVPPEESFDGVGGILQFPHPERLGGICIKSGVDCQHSISR
jgi:hypothetical protein